MSQERLQPSNRDEHPKEEPPATHLTFGFGGQLSLPLNLDGNTSVATLNHY